MLAELLQFTRFFPNKSSSGALVHARGTGLGSLAADQVAPARFEMSRAGRRFMLCDKGVGGIAPVQAWPTSAAQWVIWNNDPSRSYAFEELGVHLASGTPGVGGVLLCAMFTSPSQAALVTPSTMAIVSASNGNISSNAICTGAGVTIGAGKVPATWYTLAQNSSPNVAAFAGSTFLEHRNLQGSLVLPPNQGLALNVVAPAGTTPLFVPFATWVEIETDLE